MAAVRVAVPRRRVVCFSLAVEPKGLGRDVRDVRAAQARGSVGNRPCPGGGEHLRDGFDFNFDKG